MLTYPYVPKWWKTSNKFSQLKDGFRRPEHVIGFDTETCQGHIITMQFSCGNDDRIEWVDETNCFDIFLKYLAQLPGRGIVYCFNAKFDLAILLRKWISRFLEDDFEFTYAGWSIKVFCSRNWFATFKKGKTEYYFVDIHHFFEGSLETVAKAFKLSEGKGEKPENLGHRMFTPMDADFVEYAVQDARLCRQMGEQILDMHQHFDIPIATSKANFAEKVFRRRFLEANMQIQFPPYEAMRMAENCYHGGKNGYYYDHPTFQRRCYEYDFNSAYPYAMYCLPSFLAGKWRKVYSLSDKYVGVYLAKGRVEPCKYGILYDRHFNYYRLSHAADIETFVTSFELQEAIASGEFKMQSCIGWVWVPLTETNPLRDYSQFFWEQKNQMEKGGVNYWFYKHCLNNLYGKWIQRNPRKGSNIARLNQDGDLFFGGSDVQAGGLYNPFIGALITGHTRARLHREEHHLSAIECSTDSVKTRTLVKSYRQHAFGRMQLEDFHCKDCETKAHGFNALFVRNRLNLLMCKRGHILKAALHGFWGKSSELKSLWERRDIYYEVERMPLIREALTQSDKQLFFMQREERKVNIDWSTYQEIRA